MTSSSGNYWGGVKYRRREDPRPAREERNAEINHLVRDAAPPRSGLDRFRDRYSRFSL